MYQSFVCSHVVSLSKYLDCPLLLPSHLLFSPANKTFQNLISKIPRGLYKIVYPQVLKFKLVMDEMQDKCDCSPRMFADDIFDYGQYHADNPEQLAGIIDSESQVAAVQDNTEELSSCHKQDVASATTVTTLTGKRYHPPRNLLEFPAIEATHPGEVDYASDPSHVEAEPALTDIATNGVRLDDIELSKKYHHLSLGSQLLHHQSVEGGINNDGPSDFVVPLERRESPGLVYQGASMLVSLSF